MTDSAHKMSLHEQVSDKLHVNVQLLSLADGRLRMFDRRGILIGASAVV